MARAPRASFTRAEAGLIGSAAAIVFTRVFAFSLVLAGFTAHAEGLVPANLQGTELAAILVGIAFGAYGLTMALAQLGNGILSDRIGRRPILLAGTVLFVAGSLWAAYAGDLWSLIAARLVQGLGGVSSAAMAAVGETVPESRRTTAMAMIGIPAGLGFFLGIAAGRPLEAAIGMRGLFLVVAGLGLLASLPILFRSLPAPQANLTTPASLGDRRSLSRPVLALAAAGFSLNFALMAVTYDFQAFLAPYAGTGEVVLAGVLIGAFVIMGGASRAIDRSRSSWQPLAFCLLLLAAAAPVFRLSTTLVVLTIGGLLFFTAHSILSAVLPSQVSRLAGRSGGRGHGIQLVVAYLGTFVGGTLAGTFAGSPWPPALFVVLAILCALVALFVMRSLRPLQTDAQPPEAGPAGA